MVREGNGPNSCIAAFTHLLRICFPVAKPCAQHQPSRVSHLTFRYGSTKKMEVDANGKHCTFDCSFGINLYTSTDLLSWTFVGTHVG